MLKNLIRTSITALALSGVATVAMMAHANDNTYNRLSFGVSAHEKIANDEITARLSKTVSAKDSKTIATQLNPIMNHALSLKNKYPEVTLTTGSQYSHPTYDKNGKITGFTTQASITLKSQNNEQIGQFIADLQENFVLDGLDFSVSDKRQQEVKNRLKTQAIKDFTNEAQSLSTLWGASGYRLVNANLDHSNAYYRSTSAVFEAAPAAYGAKIATPEFEAGESQLTYSINGTIELTH
ncbi:MAG: SIMPL domain-containing protein [Moraxella sp.]|nr:SIMPL domain-containing protein [Moraxella sp.]